MISTRTFGSIAFVYLICLAGCSGSGSSGDPGGAGVTPTTTTTGGNPGACGHAAEVCCASGALCGGGLTCSDQYCLACGPAPMPANLKGCTNVAAQGTATANTAPGTTADDAHAVIDGDVCTPWNYGDYGNANAWWQVDLGSARSLQALTMWPKMTPADGDVLFRIQYKSAEGDAFTDYQSASGITLMLHDYQPWQTTFDPPIMARFFRITIVNTPSFAALREVALYSGCTP
jgi:hypothetical protein